jgi:hypothetical protein
MMRRAGAALAAALVFGQVTASSAVAADASLAPGSRVYLSLDRGVTSARGDAEVGQVVPCRVWRDVEDRGVVFIKAGTPATCRVDKVSRRNMGGFEGKLAIDGVETRSADDQLVMLQGGYNKEGSGHKAVVWTVGLLLFWPALFVPGGNAELPPGTVFDTSTVNTLKLAAADNGPRRVDLRSMSGEALSAEFMLDDFLNQPKHDVFRIKLGKSGQLPTGLVIDSVNGKSIEPIPLTVKDVKVADGDASGVAEVSAKTLAKHFARGINRFEVAYTDGGERRATEVMMDVQM